MANGNSGLQRNHVISLDVPAHLVKVAKLHVFHTT